MNVNFLHLAMILFGCLTVSSALGVIVTKKPLHSALWLVITFFMLAVNYGLLRADFIAVLQLVVYAGAIMVLVIFTLMLLGPKVNAEESETKSFKVWLLLVLLVFACLIIGFFSLESSVLENFKFNQNFIGDIQAFGRLLFSRYLCC